MQISSLLANYTLGEADLLRRAMGKKIAEEVMAKQKGPFHGRAPGTISMDEKKAGKNLRFDGQFRGIRFQ